MNERNEVYQFDEYTLDVSDRQLWRGETRIDLNPRYFDALLLLVRDHGKLVEKDTFFDVVWTDVVVTDSALTQCIKEIRKQLGDDAADPVYIQTVPRHGYRFIRELRVGSHNHSQETVPSIREPLPKPHQSVVNRGFLSSRTSAFRQAVYEWGAGTLGGAIAGLFGGLLYGFGLASAGAGVGTISTLLVLIGLNVMVGLTGGFGVSLGLASARVATHFLPKMRTVFRVAGAALGGLFIGASAKMLGLDAFNLLLGRAPAGITGGLEGAMLGASVVMGVYLAIQFGGRMTNTRPWIGTVGGGLGGAIAGVIIPLAGGRLMGGSLELLARSFVESRLELDRIGTFFGEIQFGLATQAVLGGFEGLLFGSCVMGAMTLLIPLMSPNRDIWHL